MKKENKVRIHMRSDKALDEEMKALAKNLGLTKTSLYQTACWAYLRDKARFAHCPTCQRPVFDKIENPVLDGISLVKCVMGHSHNYDYDRDVWVG